MILKSSAHLYCFEDEDLYAVRCRQCGGGRNTKLNAGEVHFN